jgi:hypothetical protein
MGRRNLVLCGRIKSSTGGRRSRRLCNVSDGVRVEGMTGLTVVMTEDEETMTEVDDECGTERRETTELLTVGLTVSTEGSTIAED